MVTVSNLKNDENTEKDYSLRASPLPAFISRLQTVQKPEVFIPNSRYFSYFCPKDIEPMSENIQQKIEQLRQELHQHNENYYLLDTPTVTDYEFDMLLQELQDLEAKHPEFYDENSPTVRVGGGITKVFPTIQHKFRMYSLDNSYDFDDLEDWEKELSKRLRIR